MATARQFDHALIARQQAALVATIARDVQEGHARPDHLDAYRASIRQERQFLNRAQQRQQEAEMARADALIALTRQVGGRERLIAMVAAIAADEQREVERARADLDHIRNRAMVLGALLAMTAMGVAVAGGVLLLRANRDLAGEVAARTAELRAIDSSRRLFFAKASHEMRTPSPPSAPSPRLHWTAATPALPLCATLPRKRSSSAIGSRRCWPCRKRRRGGRSWRWRWWIWPMWWRMRRPGPFPMPNRFRWRSAVTRPWPIRRSETGVGWGRRWSRSSTMGSSFPIRAGFWPSLFP
jgi:hypothetical protein